MADGHRTLQEIKQLETLVSRFATARMKESRSDTLCPIQCEVLSVLTENGGSMAQKDLEGRLVIRKSTLSGVLDTMERNGLVERSVSDTDRRSRAVSLTSEGIRRCGEASRQLEETERIIFDNIEKEDLEAFFRVVARVHANIEEFGIPEKTESRPIPTASVPQASDRDYVDAVVPCTCDPCGRDDGHERELPPLLDVDPVLFRL